MMSCLKHFPGHGAALDDSHVALPTVEADLELLEGRDLLPFREGIAAGAPAVMTAHVTYPALDPKAPATFSKRILGGLLRERLRFGGLVVSDDLEMQGAVGTYPLDEGARRALRAGADVVVVSGMLLAERDLGGLLDFLERSFLSERKTAALAASSLARIGTAKGRYLGDAWSADAGARTSPSTSAWPSSSCTAGRGWPGCWSTFVPSDRCSRNWSTPGSRSSTTAAWRLTARRTW